MRDKKPFFPIRQRTETLEVYCRRDRKSTRLNSSHLVISYAVFCLKKKPDVGAYPVKMLSCGRAGGDAKNGRQKPSMRSSTIAFASWFGSRSSSSFGSSTRSQR